MTCLEVENISFKYNGEPVFEKIGFSLHAGEFTALFGANGAGKSTLLKLLLGELTGEPGGKILWFGQPVKDFQQWFKIGYVPQNNMLVGSSFPATVAEVVQANLFSQVGLFRFLKKEHVEKTKEVLRLVGMEKYNRQLIGNLSGGQQQRVMLARALVNEPQVIVLDEPTSGIDAKSAEKIYSLLRGMCREKQMAVIMVSHDVAGLSSYVGRSLHLMDGSLSEEAGHGNISI